MESAQYLFWELVSVLLSKEMTPSKMFENFQKFCILSNAFRFRDDLYNFDYKAFENNYNDICPDELELNRGNGDCCESFLKLSRSP